ncbi:glycosyltransferase, partial [Amycolatopsis suaedae]
MLRLDLEGWRVETLGLPAAGPRGPRRRGPVLCGFGEAVVPRPPDWPRRVHVTGYWYLEADAGWRPDPVLTGFLDAGPPPVFDVVRAAVRLAGCRAVLGGVTAANTDDVLTVRDVPHEWLFERMAATVHHGGAGTTGSSLRAGLPTLVCPVFSDQPFWGSRVARLGAGPDPVPMRELTAEPLLDSLERDLADSDEVMGSSRGLY